MKIITRIQCTAYYQTKKVITDTFLEVLRKETVFLNFENSRKFLAELSLFYRPAVDNF